MEEERQLVRQGSSWVERTFSEMKKDSLRGAILILVISALGTGIFTVHHLFNQIGIVWTVVFLGLIGLLYYLCTDIMIFVLFKYEESI